MLVSQKVTRFLTGGLASQILQRANTSAAESFFVPADFSDLGEQGAVLQALSRLTHAGRLERVAQGVYRRAVVPRKPVDADALARALAKRDNTRLQPTGAHAAHLLGLSGDVPMRAAYLTDGKSRTLRVGGRTVVLRRASPRALAAAGRPSGTVIQALKWLGRSAVTPEVERQLRQKLAPDVKLQLIADVKHAPAWMGAHLMRIARVKE